MGSGSRGDKGMGGGGVCRVILRGWEGGGGAGRVRVCGWDRGERWRESEGVEGE